MGETCERMHANAQLVAYQEAASGCNCCMQTGGISRLLLQKLGVRARITPKLCTAWCRILQFRLSGFLRHRNACYFDTENRRKCLRLPQTDNFSSSKPAGLSRLLIILFPRYYTLFRRIIELYLTPCFQHFLSSPSVVLCLCLL